MKFGQFELGKRVGVGAWTQVQEATADRPVLLHSLLPHLCGAPAIMRAFAAGVARAAALDHPNIQRVVGHGEVEGVPFLAFERFPSRLLATERVKRDEALSIATEVCEALSHAHSRGVVHGAVGPEHVRLGEDGVVRLGGFEDGPLDAMAHELPREMIMGKWTYVSPEVIAGGEPTPASDQFHTALLLYWMLTGVTPNAADSEKAIRAATARAQFLPLRKAAPSVPAAVSDAVMRALSRRPKDRFKSMDELAAALQLH